ncbi:MAG: hypothetical protein JWQ89_1222 [Devosia sp.]|uniref:hypothetical protein n=1 Tax=Devosia sp. TaxID=1871048 RepID=UPI00260AA808|nr:hypothetical protein [Devosia sp.]MDB5539495.1 hypothetical protein [Devosia sp.]
MPKLPQPFILLALLVAAALASPAAAQDEAQIGRIGQMSLAELGALVGAVTASVGQDTLKMEPAAQRNDCLELTRAANSFALGYRLLAEVNATLAGKPAKDVLPLRAHVVQSRVLTFAARVRAEEWLSRRCVHFETPADKVGEPRYAKPAKIETAEYTEAVIEARQAADANLAGAVAAGISRKCPDVIASMQSIQLFVPYLEKLSGDVGKRPEALGPRASRRGLEVARAQLVAAGNKLYRELGIGCRARPASEAAPLPEK